METLTQDRLLAIHELSHCAVAFHYGGRDVVTILRRADGDLEVKTGLQQSAEQLIDAGLAGVLGELYIKAGGNAEHTLAAIRGVGWRMACTTQAGRLDMELLGPMLTQELVEQSAVRVLPALASFFGGISVDEMQSLADRIGALEPGESFQLRRRDQAVH